MVCIKNMNSMISGLLNINVFQIKFDALSFKVFKRGIPLEIAIVRAHFF